MKISVVIPAYNSSTVIHKTLESVFRQTRPPDEILVMDDGSQDDTVSILNSYKPRLTVFQHPNHGVAATRNELCKLASGDLIALLDHDDIWHPSYLEVQSRGMEKHPTATAFFTLHVDFSGLGGYEWGSGAISSALESEVIDPTGFLNRYNRSTGTFYSMSFCCVPRWLMARLHGVPFCEAVSGVDDCYFSNLLPLHGSVVLTAARLGAYRVRPHAQSSNQLKNFQNVVQVFDLLDLQYREAGNASLLRSFQIAFAGKLRRYGKTLMGVGRLSEARQQFRRAMTQSLNPSSFAKSAFLLSLSYLPAPLHPRWPSRSR